MKSKYYCLARSRLSHGSQIGDKPFVGVFLYFVREFLAFTFLHNTTINTLSSKYLKLSIILMSALIFTSPVYAAGSSNVSIQYGWNGTNFVPLLAEANGRLISNMNVSQAVGIAPAANNTYDLGTTSLMWSDMYVRNVRSPSVLSLIAGTTEAVTILGSGYVGIGNTTPPERLSISGNLTFTNGPRITDDNGRLKLWAGGALNGSGNTSSIYFLDSSGTIRGRFDTNFSSGGPSNSYGTFYMGATNTAAADLAEYYPTSDSTIEAGDVVSLADGLVKSYDAYDSRLIGVISTLPGLILGSPDSASHEHDRLLALAGRTPVKVSNENGLIEIDDYLTSSNIPGVAMKMTGPGIAIGRALERFDGDGVGKIDVFVSVKHTAMTQARQKQIEMLREQNAEIKARIAVLERKIGGK